MQSVPTNQMLAQVQERIEALEVKSRTDEEIQRSLGEFIFLAADAQDALAIVSAEANSKADPMAALESKYLELYQDLQRRQREFEKTKQHLLQENSYYRKETTKLASEKKKIEELCRTLTKERTAFRGQGQTMDATRGNEQFVKRPSSPASVPKRTLDGPSSVASPAPPPGSNHITFVISSRYRRPLWFKAQRHTKLSSVFSNWLDRQADSTISPDPPVILPKSSKKARLAAINAAAVAPHKPKFVFTYAGKVIDSTKSAGEAGLNDSDEVVAFELVDLTEDVTPEIPVPQVEKLKRYWSSDVKIRDAALEEILTTVCRERLKSMLRQYELQEEHWFAILKAKELEIVLCRAKLAVSEAGPTKLNTTTVATITTLAADLVKFGNGFQNVIVNCYSTMETLDTFAEGRPELQSALKLMLGAITSWHRVIFDLIERGFALDNFVQASKDAEVSTS